MRRLFLCLATVLFVASVSSPAWSQQSLESSCILCHTNTDFFDVEETKLVEDFLGSVHAAAGLSCHDCHGGNHDPALFEDIDAAMDSEFGPRPYLGSPSRLDVPSTCGDCHSDPSYMRRFRPDARVDQEREYWTSQHGVALRQGDTNVAVCTDCHGVHDIAGIEDPRSHVFPKRVAETCAGCHADAEHMAGYRLADGRELPTDQFARWRESVHATALLDREDLSAPTCNDCHGNHGAQPPGVDSISFVCGQCHGREADLFRESSKIELWEEHNEFLADAEFESCTACHDESEPQGAISTMHHFGECGSCHGNHAIVRPTLAFFAPFEATPCAFCHEADDGRESQEQLIGARKSVYPETRDALLEEARQQGLFSEDQFNWLVDRSLTLEAHGGSEQDGETSTVRQRFTRLFEKFRISKTYHEFTPEGGAEPVRIELRRCTWCHADAPLLADASEGHRVGQEMASQVISLMSMTAQAERSMAAARSGGIELRDAMLDIDRAIDAQIDLQVLAHRFRTDGEFAEAVAEGRAFAEAAIAAGEEAQDELRFRRLGLLVFLGFVVCVLIGLALKIRQG